MNSLPSRGSERDRREHREEADQDRRPGLAQRDVHERLVDAADGPRDGVLLLGADRAADEQSRAAPGARVIESSAAESITNVFVYASGLKSRPAWPVRPNTGRNETAMISSEKKIAGVTSLRRLGEQLPARSRRQILRRVLELLVRGLDHHDLGVDRGADRDRDPAERHDRRRDPEQHHRDEGEQHRERQRDDRQERARAGAGGRAG